MKTADKLSTYIVGIKFYDENNNPVTPKTATWTLLDKDENVVNNRLRVPISNLSANVEIVLSGADLDVDDNSIRTVVVEATYDSSLEADLPLKSSIVFDINEIPYI